MFVKLPYLEAMFLETTVFGLCRPIIYRRDDLFQFCSDFLPPVWA